MIKSTLSAIVIFSIISVIYDVLFSFGREDETVEKKKSEKESQHHTPFKGICAPGFASLGKICLLNDRCGPVIYPGKVCVMDGKIQPYLRPLHQGNAGLSADNIICAEGKELVFKTHNAKPACIDSDSVSKIKLRGWQTTKPPIACTLEYAPVCGMDGKTYGNICSMRAEYMELRHQGECNEKSMINSFEDCVKSGNPTVESHPRQCRTDDGKHFVENINSPESTSSIFIVDSKLVECFGVAKQMCMLVKEKPNDDWEIFYDQIDGFEFQNDYSYKLKIKITEIENPPNDSSSLKYSLEEILEKILVKENLEYNSGVFPQTILYTKHPPVIDSEKGYFVDEIANGIYLLIGGDYQVMFLTTSQGVIVIDAPPPLGEKYIEAIEEVTDEPVTHMVYSHSHVDHTGSAGQIFHQDIEFISHKYTADLLISENDPNRPIPTITFENIYDLSIGNQMLELHYIGPFHSEGDIVVFSPKDKIAMAVDLFHTRAAPYRDFGVKVNLDEHLKAHDILIEDFEFDVLISGPGQILGTKDHVKTDKEFVLSVMNNTKKAIDSVPEDEVILTCVDLTTQQWEGKLADLDLFMTEHCIAVKDYLLEKGV